MMHKRGYAGGNCLPLTIAGSSFWRPSCGRSVPRLLCLIVVTGALLIVIGQWCPTGSNDNGFALIFFLTPPYYEGHQLWSQGDELTVPDKLQHCAYSRCRITSNPALGDRANLIIFQGPFAKRCCERTDGGDVVCSNGNRTSVVKFTLPRISPTNAFVFYQKESPLRSSVECLRPLDDYVNYTWTYRLDSDLLDRYGSYSPISSTKQIPRSDLLVTGRNWSKNVLWYVSNCNLTGEALARLEYARELQRHIDVDIFGGCAGRSDGCQRSNKSCVIDVRSAYRFYLAFENSHCNDYVTEKLFDSLRYGNVPVVRGLPREQYERLAPPGSFIHVDDFDGPASLARRLLALAADEAAYAQYHAWRADFRIEFDDEVDMCELCRLATTRPRKSTRVSEWWDSSTNCMVYQEPRAVATAHRTAIGLRSMPVV